jgi:FAD/FMN-containing dehydrogenase
MRRSLLVLVALGLLATALLPGCGGRLNGSILGPNLPDPIQGLWTVTAQSDTLIGTQIASTISGSITFNVSPTGTYEWQGALDDSRGVRFNPGNGYWAIDGTSYDVSNSVGRDVTFVTLGAQLYTIVTSGGKNVYLWWTHA